MRIRAILALLLCTALLAALPSWGGDGKKTTGETTPQATTTVPATTPPQTTPVGPVDGPGDAVMDDIFDDPSFGNDLGGK